MRLIATSICALLLLTAGCGLLRESVSGLWQTQNEGEVVDLSPILPGLNTGAKGHFQMVIQQYQEDVAGTFRIYDNPTATSTEYWWPPRDGLADPCGCMYLEQATTRGGTLRFGLTFVDENKVESTEMTVYATLQLDDEKDPAQLKGYFHPEDVDCLVTETPDSCIAVEFRQKLDRYIREKSMDEGCSTGACN